MGAEPTQFGSTSYILTNRQYVCCLDENKPYLTLPYYRYRYSYSDATTQMMTTTHHITFHRIDNTTNQYDFAAQQTLQYGDFNYKEDFRMNHSNYDMHPGSFGINKCGFGNNQGGILMNQSNEYMHGQEN
jgi:hypothetical protein